jgi:hypothetical protein
MVRFGVLHWLCTIAVLINASASLRAQRLDSFEGGSPRWRLVESDCGAQLTGQELTQIMPRAGRSSEMFELVCSNGQFALMAYPIEPCTVLNEFQPSIWCRCASAQIRLGTRVVFPNAMHPITHSRLTTIIWSEPYRQPGNWERLVVKQIGDRLQQEVFAIRNQFDTQLNLENPYIDALVINAYTGPGRTRVQLDDLDMSSMIPLASVGIPLPGNWRDKWCWRDDTQVQFTSSNHFPVWVENRGEQPEWLRSLGFNGMMLNRLPSPAQLDVVFDAGMSIISPPPEHLVEFDEKKLAAVRGWLIGTAMNRRQADLARQQAALAERLPQTLKRPLYGEALEQYWLFGRIANEVIVPAPDPISAGDTSTKRLWLGKALETVKQRGEGWVSIFAGPNPALVDQHKAVEERLQGRTPTATPVNPMGLRHEVFGALMAGAKGIMYRTPSPLRDPISEQTDEDRALQAAIRWTNNDLRTFSPWINFGQQTDAPQVDRDDYTSASWRVRDAELIILQNNSPHSQINLPGTRNAPVTITKSSQQEPHEVLRITESRTELLRVERTPSAESWRVNSPNSIELFVVTGNQQVQQYLRQRCDRLANENASDQLEIANYYLTLATELVDARFRAPRSETNNELSLQQQTLMNIQQLIQSGWRALEAQQPKDASSIALQSIDRTGVLMHEAYLVAIANLATPQSSPMVLTPGLLKYHWLLADACQRSNWQPLELPGSQLANLDQMLNNGWSQHRRLEDQVEQRVELLPAVKELPPSLRLAAYPKNFISSNKSFESIPGGYEGASLVVHSSTTPVKRGQLVRVTAQAHVLHCGNDPTSGVLVYDNQAGPSLGQLVRGAAGERKTVELYRAINQDGDLRLSTECRGICDIRIDSINISVIEPATYRSSFDSQPVQPQTPAGVGLPANSANADSKAKTTLQR